MDDFQKALLRDEVAVSGGEVIVHSLSIFQRTQKKKPAKRAGGGVEASEASQTKYFLV